MPSGIDSKNYRLHAILGAIAEADDRYADSSAEYSLALNNLPAQVPEGPLYPIELRLNLYELDLRQDDEAAAKQQLDAAFAAINQVTVPTSSRPEMLRLRAAIEAGPATRTRRIKICRKRCLWRPRMLIRF